MRLLHLIFGIVIVVVFLLTGQYMEFLHVRDMPDGLRILYRSRHIYILASGLVHLALATYLTLRTALWQRVLQWLGSVSLIASSLILLVAFFYDPERGDLAVPWSRQGIFALGYGTLFHVFSGLGKRSVA